MWEILFSSVTLKSLSLSLSQTVSSTGQFLLKSIASTLLWLTEILDNFSLFVLRFGILMMPDFTKGISILVKKDRDSHEMPVLHIEEQRGEPNLSAYR